MEAVPQFLFCARRTGITFPAEITCYIFSKFFLIFGINSVKNSSTRTILVGRRRRGVGSVAVGRGMGS
jgi:hypothetical protein